jgi:hypothetical protein
MPQWHPHPQRHVPRPPLSASPTSCGPSSTRTLTPHPSGSVPQSWSGAIGCARHAPILQGALAAHAVRVALQHPHARPRAAAVSHTASHTLRDPSSDALTTHAPIPQSARATHTCRVALQRPHARPVASAVSEVSSDALTTTRPSSKVHTLRTDSVWSPSTLTAAQVAAPHASSVPLARWHVCTRGHGGSAQKLLCDFVVTRV